MFRRQLYGIQLPMQCHQSTRLCIRKAEAIAQITIRSINVDFLTQIRYFLPDIGKSRSILFFKLWAWNRTLDLIVSSQTRPMNQNKRRYYIRKLSPTIFQVSFGQKYIRNHHSVRNAIFQDVRYLEKVTIYILTIAGSVEQNNNNSFT